MKVKVKNQELPAWVGEIIASSPRHARDSIIFYLSTISWTYQAISAASGLTRERVRQICNAMATVSLSTTSPAGMGFPKPPTITSKLKKVYVEPSVDTLDRLLALKPIAQMVRGSGKKYRREAEEYTALLNHAHKVEGVSLYRLAKRLGVTHAALRFRLCRYGYLKPGSGRSGVYTPISLQNRFG
jgi:hypothetical protein